MTWFLWLNLFFICRCQLIEIRLLKYELVDARNSNKKKMFPDSKNMVKHVYCNKKKTTSH